MTASTKPKTPNMTLPILSSADNNEIEEFCKRASRLTLSQVAEKVVVKERLSIKHGSRTKEYTVNICFFPVEDYQKEYRVDVAEVLNCFGNRFARLLRKEILLELKRLDADLKNQSRSIGEGRAEQGPGVGGGEDAEDEAVPQGNDSSSEVGDGDADDAKRVRQSKQQTTYEDDSDDDVPDQDAIALDHEGIEAAFRDEYMSDDLGKAESGDGDSSTESNDDDLTTRIKAVESLFLKNLKHVKSFSFNESGCSFDLEVCIPFLVRLLSLSRIVPQYGSDMPKLLLVGVVERTCRKTVIREIADIKDCFVVAQEKGGLSERIVCDTPNAWRAAQALTHLQLMTNGSNYLGMWQAADHVTDIDGIYSNDIYSSLRTYGVEMARGSIVREMRAVFQAYSISVDDRHLELIADYMVRLPSLTFSGSQFISSLDV
jgi:RNA polymerase Rpb1, domain 5